MLTGLVKLITHLSPIFGLATLAVAAMFVVEAYRRYGAGQCLLTVACPFYIIYFGFIKSHRSPRWVAVMTATALLYLTLNGIGVIIDHNH